MDAVQQKIAKASKSVSRLLSVGSGVTLLLALLFMVGIGILTFSEPSTSSSLREAFSVLEASGGAGVPSIGNLTVLFGFAVVELLLFFLVLRILRSIFADVAGTYTPFVPQNVARMKQAALLTLGICVFSTVFDGVGHQLLYGNAVLTANVLWLVPAVVTYCIAHIFDYGCRLQKESDETL